MIKTLSTRGKACSKYGVPKSLGRLNSEKKKKIAWNKLLDHVLLERGCINKAHSSAKCILCFRDLPVQLDFLYVLRILNVLNGHK